MFFSVIIPVYNKAAYLSTSVNSVLKQSFRDFELLIVADPSTDGSTEIAENFSDKRIRLFKREVAGPGGYAARNLGIDNASARWIAFLDADDVWEADFLKNVYHAIAQNSHIQLFCSGFTVGTVKLNRPYSYFRKFSTKGNHEFDFKQFLLNKPIHTSSVIISKELFLLGGGFPAGKFNRGGDSETWLRLMSICKKGYWVNYIGAVYNNTVADSVIKANDPYLMNHPVRLLVISLLANPSNKEFEKELKQHSNSFILPTLRSLGRKSLLSPLHLRALFFQASLVKPRILALAIMSLLPSFMQHFFIKNFKSKKSL